MASACVLHQGFPQQDVHCNPGYAVASTMTCAFDQGLKLALRLAGLEPLQCHTLEQL